MSLIPAKTSGLKLSSWVFDGRVPKDCGYAPIKVAGALAPAPRGSLNTKYQEQRRISDQRVAAGLAKSLVVHLPATYRLPYSV